MCLSSKVEIAKTLGLGAIVEIIFILASIIDIEITKIAIDFLKVLSMHLNNSLFCYSFNT